MSTLFRFYRSNKHLDVCFSDFVSMFVLATCVPLAWPCSELLNCQNICQHFSSTKTLFCRLRQCTLDFDNKLSSQKKELIPLSYIEIITVYASSFFQMTYVCMLLTIPFHAVHTFDNIIMLVTIVPIGKLISLKHRCRISYVMIYMYMKHTLGRLIIIYRLPHHRTGTCFQCNMFFVITKGTDVRNLCE